MYASMTCNTAIFAPSCADAHPFLSALRRLSGALLKTNRERPCVLPAYMAANASQRVSRCLQSGLPMHTAAKLFL